MDNVLNYLIQLKADRGNLPSVATQATNELAKIETSAKSVGSSLKEAFSFKNFKSSLMGIPGMQFLMNPYTIIGAGIGAVTKLGAEAEMTSVSFNKLVGDEQKAADTLAEIKEFANNTPYETMDLVDSAKQMLSFGVSTEQTVNMLKRLGDISMGDKNKLSSLGLVYSQVASQGKMQGQDFLQFVNAGFNPIQELSEMTGKTTAELKDMMSKGQIGATAVSAAIEHATNEGGKFFGMSDSLAGTTSGKISTLMGKISEMASNAYQAIQPLVNGLLDIATWLTDNMDLVAAFASAVGIAALALNGATIATGIYTAVTSAATTVQGLFNAVLTMNPIGLVITAIGALAAGVIYCWNKFAGFRAFIITMWDTIKAFGTIIKDYLVNRITDLLSGIGELGSALAKLFNGDFEGAWDSAKSAASKISGANAASKAIGQSVKAINGVGANYQKNLTEQQKKQSSGAKTNKVSTPGLSGSSGSLFETGTGKSGTSKGKGVKSKDASEITTGGTRNTSITMNISKFFDNLQVTMTDKADTAELETIVVQSLNRALAIATSTDR